MDAPAPIGEWLVDEIAEDHGLGKTKAALIVCRVLEAVEQDCKLAGTAMGGADPDLAMAARVLALRFVYAIEKLEAIPKRRGARSPILGHPAGA